MIRLHLLAPALLFLTVGVSEAAVTRYTTSTARGATGTTCSLASRCTNATAISLSAAGDTVSMEGNTISNPYVYQGANDMLEPSSGRSGISANPITVKCEVDGGCLINGEFTRVPLKLASNNYWAFEGFNVKNGALSAACSGGGTIYIHNSSNNSFRRIIAWDACINSNAHTVRLISSPNNTFEDFAAFGTGRKNFEPYQGSNNTICRRCWFRWEGTLGGGALGATVGYRSTGTIWENVLVTWSGESMPETYADTSTGNLMTNYETFNPPGLFGTDRLESTTTPKNAIARIRGSVSYTKSTDRLPSTVSGGDAGGKLPGIRIYGASDIVMTDVIRVMSTLHPRFNEHLGFSLTRRSQNCVHGMSYCEDPVINNTATRITSVRGTKAFGNNVGDSFGRSGVPEFADETDWTVSNKSLGNCVMGSSQAPCTGTHTNAVQTPWQNTSIDGARLCYRTVDGVVQTNVPLWPWPMNERIKKATGMAGSYSGPCPTCVGGRASRIETDVTADIEGLLGTIPASCRSAGPLPQAPKVTGLQ